MRVRRAIADQRDAMREIIGIVAAFFVLMAAEAVAAPARANIVLMMADDMGWSDLGCYGGEIETPHLDSLARNGARFTQFYNAARCCPTRAALLTGLYPHQAGVGHMVADDGLDGYRGFLNNRCVTLAEVLREAGYATLMVGKWHVGSRPGHWPLDRGFRHYWGTPSGGGVYFREALQRRKEVFFVADEQRVEFPEGRYVTDLFTDQAIAMISSTVKAGQGPFFLYFAHIAPHWPLQAKPEDIKKYEGRYDVGWDEVRRCRFERQMSMGLLPPGTRLSPRDKQAEPWDSLSAERRRELAHRMAVYAAQIDCIDQNVGRLVSTLKELGQFDNTVFIFLSDNGCSAEGGPGGFNRDQTGAPIGTGRSYASAGLEWANASNTPFRRYKMSTHEGGIATPMIVHWPAGIAAESPSGQNAAAPAAAGRLIHAPGHVIDVMPTLVELAGANYPKRWGQEAVIPCQGRSLAPMLAGRPAADGADVPRSLFWEHEGNKAARRGDWKAVASASGIWELYRIDRDRTELVNLADDNPKELSELVAQWQQWAEQCGIVQWRKLQQLRRQARGSDSDR